MQLLYLTIYNQYNSLSHCPLHPAWEGFIESLHLTPPPPRDLHIFLCREWTNFSMPRPGEVHFPPLMDTPLNLPRSCSKRSTSAFPLLMVTFPPPPFFFFRIPLPLMAQYHVSGFWRVLFWVGGDMHRWLTDKSTVNNYINTFINRKKKVIHWPWSAASTCGSVEKVCGSRIRERHSIKNSVCYVYNSIITCKSLALVFTLMNCFSRLLDPNQVWQDNLVNS